jgi:hypothetical protein
MDIRHSRRVRACLVSTLCLGAVAGTAHASTLVAFSFDGANAGFDAAPGTLAPDLISAVWRDDLGRLGDLTGNPGRALSVSGFTGINKLHLVIEQDAAQRFALERLHFDIRGSASGPNSWSLSQAGTQLASGAITTGFRSFDIPLNVLSDARQLVLDLAGSGATAITGTLRLDNVRLDGELRPVPLPGSFFLFATPLLGALLARLRIRCTQLLGAGHSRQPSSKGKYRPSMMGRGSRLAMMRP